MVAEQKSLMQAFMVFRDHVVGRSKPTDADGRKNLLRPIRGIILAIVMSLPLWALILYFIF
jgi:hypothetical protein